MEIEKINAQIIGAIGAVFTLLVGGIGSGLFSKDGIPLLFVGKENPWWILWQEVHLDTSTQVFLGLLITLLLVSIFGGLFVVIFDGYRNKLNFEASDETWEEWTGMAE